MDVPDSDNSIFTTTDEVFSIGWDGEGGNLVVVTGDGAVEFFSLEELLFLVLNVPKD